MLLFLKFINYQFIIKSIILKTWRMNISLVLLSMSFHIFYPLLCSAKLRDKLLNQKEQNVQKSTGKVRRYRPGVVNVYWIHNRKVPDWVREKQEEERKMEEQTHAGDIAVKIEKKKVEKKNETDVQDPRLERLLATQQQRQRPARRRHVEAEIIMDEEEKPALKFDAPPQPEKEKQDDSANRRRLLSRALEEVES